MPLFSSSAKDTPKSYLFDFIQAKVVIVLLQYPSKKINPELKRKKNVFVSLPGTTAPYDPPTAQEERQTGPSVSSGPGDCSSRAQLLARR